MFAHIVASEQAFRLSKSSFSLSMFLNFKCYRTPFVIRCYAYLLFALLTSLVPNHFVKPFFIVRNNIAAMWASAIYMVGYGYKSVGDSICCHVTLLGGDKYTRLSGFLYL